MKSVVIFVFCLVEAVVGQGSVSTPAGTLKYDEDWGYVQVRQSAHTFWWLFTVKTDPTRPLILWLQGGPGSDSTGFGNLDEIGPKDVTLKDRNSTWLQIGDLVFVDNPVGAGFSYVDESSAFTTNVQQIGADLLVWAKAFFGKKHPEYQNRNFYIACESYGGKMTAEFAKQLQDAIDDGVIKAKLGGVLLGDSWISPIDFVNTWGPYLHAVSYLDDKQLTTANAKADECQKLVDNQQWYDSTVCWGEIEDLIGDLTAGVSWYNILKAGGSDDWSKKKFLKTNKMAKKSGPLQRLYDNHVGQFRLDAISDLMDGQMRKKFGIIPNQIRFGAQSGAVFNKQYGDFMKPNYNTVDNLLNRGVNVTIVNGQLDLICNTLGVELWLKRLSWSGRDTFLASQKNSYAPTNENKVYGFWKQHNNLKMYYILRSGHMYGHDAPWATLEALKTVFK